MAVKVKKPPRVGVAEKSLREEVTAYLRRKAPEAFSNGRLDTERLAAFLGKDSVAEGERYFFTWAGRQAAIELLQQPPTGALIPYREESVNFDETANLYLEADNLEALKLLRTAYAGRVKMMYIDPPYNTGNEFIYSDNFRDPLCNYLLQTGQLDKKGKATRASARSEEKLVNGRKHSRWLSMMYPRLVLARDLLREDGVIFISIDDNEMHHLRLLMNMVFGEENFVGCVTVAGNPAGRDYGGIARMHDYLLVYARSENSQIHKLANEEKKFPYEDKEGEFEIRELRNRNVAFNIDNRPNLYYPFYVNLESRDKDGFYEISLSPFINGVEVYPLESQGKKTVWRWGKKRAQSNLNSQIMAKEMRKGGFQIVEKYREKSKMARSIWADKEVRTEKGTLLVKEIFSRKVYDFPKSVEMIARIISMGTEVGDNCLVMDFFSGSATTAHAVMELNAEDGGARQCISIQLPEPCDKDSEARKAGYKNIADIGRERLRRVGVKLREKLNGDKVDVGFRVFKYQNSNFPQIWEGESEDGWKKAHKKMLLTLPPRFDPETALFEVILAEGYPLDCVVEVVKVKGAKVFKVTDKNRDLTMHVCLDTKLPDRLPVALGLKLEDVLICRDDALASDTQAANYGSRCFLKVI